MGRFLIEGIRSGDIENIERVVEATRSFESMRALIQARMRSGLIRGSAVRNAVYFSARLTPPGSTSGPYDWHPLQRSFNELQPPPGAFEQDPRTLALYGACQSALPRGGWWRPARGALPRKTWEWMTRRGFFVSETGGVGNHAPYEIQSDDSPDTEGADRWQSRIATAYEEATGEPGQISDTIYMWFVRRGVFAGEPQPTKIMRWLRVNSTVEYCNVLGANVYNQSDRHDPPFGLTEYRLVSNLLGGDPL